MAGSASGTGNCNSALRGHMNTWMEEHVRTLSQLSGISPQEAQTLFDQPLYIALDPAMRDNATYRLAFVYAVNLLTRLFPATQFDDLRDKSLLILPWGGISPLSSVVRSSKHVLLFGNGPAKANGARSIVTANCHDWQVYIDVPCEPDPREPWNPVLALTTACYAAARITKLLLGDAVDGPDTWHPFSILDFRQASVDFDWSAPFEIDQIYLAGIGAIGSATLLAMAAHGAASGKLMLVDHDLLEWKNLGRYTFFDAGDEGIEKALAAKKRLDNLGLRVSVEPISDRFEKHYDKEQSRNPRFGIPRLLSAPDRRDTRRQFQSRLPCEIWDASTGPDQVVLHHNSFNPKLACLSCIYPEIPSEYAHWEHVAEKLDVPLDRLLSGDSITERDAVRIVAKYPHLLKDDVEGRAFDSVFRDLCSAGTLRGSEKSVLAPFPFISGLAGVMLYFEFVKSMHSEVFDRYQQYNYTQLNPFFPPNPEFRELRPSKPDCFCQDTLVRNVFSKIWGNGRSGGAHKIDVSEFSLTPKLDPSRSSWFKKRDQRISS